MMSSDDDKPLVVRNQKAIRKQIVEVTSDDELLIPTPPTKRARTSVTQRKKQKDEVEPEEERNGKQKGKRASSKKPVITKSRQKPIRSAITRKKAVKEELDDDDMTKSNLSFKEGQKHLCPPMGDGTRAFYESLLKEQPDSVMANKYCIEHGVLIGTQHKEQYLRYQQLRDLGAFKGAAGGVKPQFRNLYGAVVENLPNGKNVRGAKTGTRKTATSAASPKSK